MTNSLPLVSIGVPTFNRPAELRRLLTQLLTQTYPNLEIIVLDNCSTLPEVAEIGQEFASGYPHIHYFLNDENLGVLKNTAALRSYARGEYFCWVSDDDWRAPEFIQLLVEALEKNQHVEFAFCDYYEVLADGKRAPGYPKSHLPIFKPFQNVRRWRRTLAYFWQSGRLGKCNFLYALFRKRAIDALDLESISGGYAHLNMDCLLAFRLLQRGPVVLCDEALVTLTCGNPKNYVNESGKKGGGIGSRLWRFLSGQKQDRDRYLANTDSLLEKMAIHLLFLPKLAWLAFDALQRTSTPSAIEKMHPPHEKKLHLPNVTLIAMATRNVEETLQALRYSCLGVRYGSVKLLSHYTPYGLDSDIEFHRIDKIKSIDDWSYKIVYQLNDNVDTDFALLVHADGFVVNPESWRDEFLQYDYIGAPWPLPKDDFSYRDIHGAVIRVGNSVSVRSKRLLALPSQLPIPWEADHGYFNEDGFICVKNRHVFETHGMRFAPLEIAKYFSHEVMIPEVRGIRPFAFHKWAGSNRDYPRF